MRKIGEACVAYGLFEAYRMEIGRRRRKGKKATGSPPSLFVCYLWYIRYRIMGLSMIMRCKRYAGYKSLFQTVV